MNSGYVMKWILI